MVLPFYYLATMNRFLNWLVILIICIPCSNIEATHLIGGEINYRCLGNDNYEIYMTVYRDCINGVPYFDNPVSIGIYDINNNLLQDRRVFLMADDTLPGFLDDSCFLVPPVACVHRATYVDTVSLPVIPGGYQFSYQRCCRNGTILNIVAPDSTGMTLYSTISEEGLLGCNNSAYFINWPPIYICAGLPIIFDHSTLDIDGDSIVYRMCAPFDGAESSGNYNCVPQPCGVRPQPPFSPNYDSVQWISPPFSAHNMLGGPLPLTIDEFSGLLTGTPCCIGQYVVGVCAEEYRNGVLISTTKRDFQYNIGNCNLLNNASFFTPEIVCSNDIFQVNFSNQSSGLNSYFWDFGDLNTFSDTSGLAAPSYVYSDTGAYNIMLIVAPGTICADTFFQEINLQYESLNVDFVLEYQTCADSIVIDFIDISTDSISVITDWWWDFGNGDTSTVQYPTIQYDTAGTYIVELVVTAANGCMATADAVVTFGNPTINTLDSFLICLNDPPVQLNPNGDPTYDYLWTPATGLNNPTLANPLASPSQTTTYTVEVTTFNLFDTCTIYEDVTVVVPPPILLDAGPDDSVCDNFYQLNATSQNATNIIWSSSPTFVPVLNPTGSSSIQVPLFLGANEFYVKAQDDFGCEITDQIIIDFPEVNLLGDTVLVCVGNDAQLTVTNLNPADPLTYVWTPSTGILSGQGTETITIAPTSATEYWVTGTNQTGCLDSALFIVDVSALTPPLSVTVDRNFIYPGETVQLNGTVDPNYTYTWVPKPSLSATDIVDPTAAPLVTTIYELLITDQFGCINSDTVTVEIRAFICDEPYIFVPNAFTPNGDNVNDVLYVRANAVTDVYFAVYSRWGEQMFETTDLQVGWDGTFKGKELSPDVYGYYLRLRCLNNEEYFKKGNVTLLR